MIRFFSVVWLAIYSAHSAGGKCFIRVPVPGSGKFAKFSYGREGVLTRRSRVQPEQSLLGVWTDGVDLTAVWLFPVIDREEV
jgi:hypothetical protein